MLRDTDIHPDDRRAIRRFAESKDGDVNLNTLTQYINRYRSAPNGSTLPLVEMPGTACHRSYPANRECGSR